MALGRFLLVGGACAALHNAILIGADAVGVHYAVSTLVSFAVVSAAGYGLHTRWTWREARRGLRSYLRYALAMSANLPLSLAGMAVAVELVALPVVLAAPLVTVLLVVFNVAASRWSLGVPREPSRGARQSSRQT